MEASKRVRDGVVVRLSSVFSAFNHCNFGSLTSRGVSRTKSGSNGGSFSSGRAASVPLKITVWGFVWLVFRNLMCKIQESPYVQGNILCFDLTLYSLIVLF